MHVGLQGLPMSLQLPQAIWRAQDWGDMHVSFEVYRQELDSRPVLARLPGGQCQCPHWGYVLKGRLRAYYGEEEEVITAGQAYYLVPGHTIVVEAGTELFELSPRQAFAEHMAAVNEAGIGTG